MPAHGFAGTHNRIPPVDVEVQAPGLGRRWQQCVDPGPDLLENLADRGDHDGVSNPGHGNAAVTHAPRPLDLQVVVAGSDKAAAGHGHPAAANILEMHLPQVQLATGARQDTGVGFLVEGMGCNRCRGKTAVVAQGLQHEPVIFQYAQGAVRAGAGAGGDGGAFQDLAQVAAHRGAIGKGLACPQVVWPGVGRARVHGNQVRVAGQAALERRLGKAVTQDGGG